MTPQEKYEIKRLWNQLSGARSRKRKMNEGEQLHADVEELQEQNSKVIEKSIELRDCTEKKILEILAINKEDSNSQSNNLNLE